MTDERSPRPAPRSDDESQDDGRGQRDSRDTRHPGTADESRFGAATVGTLLGGIARAPDPRDDDSLAGSGGR